MLSLIKFGNILKKKFPADRPIIIRTVKMPYTNKDKERGYGDANDLETHYLIRINKDHELSIQKDTLMHEWAHCMAGWDDDHDSHSRRWGICYSDIYRVMVGD